MAKLNFIRDGVIRLPPGFRFQPTDDELVFQYLKRKVFSLPLPASIIPEINVSNYDPWDFPGDLKQEKYFFWNKEAKYRNGNRTSRMAGSGYWKATGPDKKIISSARNQLMGMKKTLVFYRRKPSRGSRTDWVMHEYRLVCSETTLCIFQQTTNSSQLNSLIQMEDWVLCRIFLRKRSTADDGIRNVGVARPKFFDSTLGDRTNYLSDICYMLSSSSSSNSSVITEVSSSGSDHEESSDCNSSSSSSCFGREP